MGAVTLPPTEGHVTSVLSTWLSLVPLVHLVAMLLSQYGVRTSQVRND